MRGEAGMDMGKNKLEAEGWISSGGDNGIYEDPVEGREDSKNWDGSPVVEVEPSKDKGKGKAKDEPVVDQNVFDWNEAPRAWSENEPKVTDSNGWKDWAPDGCAQQIKDVRDDYDKK